MTDHRMMIFKLTQGLTQEKAVQIARMYQIPASTIDEIERKNPGITLVRALEQRLILCEDVAKLVQFYNLLKELEYDDLAFIIQKYYPQIAPEPISPPPSNVRGGNCGSSSQSPQNDHNPELTSRRGPVMPPVDEKEQLSSQASSGETTLSGGVVMKTEDEQLTFQAPSGETTISGGVLMKTSENMQ